MSRLFRLIESIFETSLPKAFVWAREMVSDCSVLGPREAAAFVASRAKHVSVDAACVAEVAPTLLSLLRDSSFRSYYSKSDVHPDPGDPRAVDWIFVCSTLNFCFWHEDADYSKSSYVVEHDGKRYLGYFALCAALCRAVDKGIDVTNPGFYADVTSEQLESILRSADGRHVPLLKERVEALRDAGTVLNSKYGGTAANLVAEAGKSAEKLLHLVVRDFVSYKDEFGFEGRRLGIYKRAQIFVADLWACFEGQGPGEFSDINFLTCFADYRVPQILETLGVLVYDEHVKQMLVNKVPFASGSREEIEIRGCTIQAVEDLKREILKLIPSGSTEAEKLNSALLDHHLWDLCKAETTVLRLPYHRTRSWFY